LSRPARLPRFGLSPRFAALPADLSAIATEPLLDWAGAELSRLGRPVTGEPLSLRQRQWSIVAQLPTGAGPVWVKANAAGFAAEAALLELLAEQAPGAALVPLGIDPDRGRMITADGGPTLLARMPDGELGAAAGWQDLMLRHGALQRRLTGLAEPAVALGVPDLRTGLADLLEPAVAAASHPAHGEHRLDGDEARTLLALRSWLTGLAEQLAASPVPATVEHNDPHLNNVFAATDEFLDFGDAVVAHPFLSLAGAAAQAARGTDPAALQAVYLAGFADLAPPARLRRDAEVAVPLHELVRAATWLRIPDPGRAGWAPYLPGRLRRLARLATSVRGTSVRGTTR
jgi:Phosphotransferase enzyme family